ncbi:MAG: DUF2214 family protein [Deltaproteobacteria bacterium]|nr:DUF2214 family protein [Kofleriaceae bacterium]
MLAAIASALHVLGIALAATFATLRLFALRRQDVPATRFADNGNGIAAILLFGAGFWRLFSELEKPLAFYTANPIFWIKMGAVAVMVALEAYPQYVVLPWHIRHSRKQPIEPKPRQFERMFRLCALQLPCILVVIVSAALMAPGRLLVASAAGGGKTAGDFVGDPAILAQPDAALLDTIARGKAGRIGAMPGFGSMLTPQQQRDVLAYLRATFGQSASQASPAAR